MKTQLFSWQLETYREAYAMWVTDTTSSLDCLAKSSQDFSKETLLLRLIMGLWACKQEKSSSFVFVRRLQTLQLVFPHKKHDTMGKRRNVIRIDYPFPFYFRTMVSTVDFTND